MVKLEKMNPAMGLKKKNPRLHASEYKLFTNVMFMYQIIYCIIMCQIIYQYCIDV